MWWLEWCWCCSEHADGDAGGCGDAGNAGGGDGEAGGDGGPVVVDVIVLV